jgi:hypothetical protein
MAVYLSERSILIKAPYVGCDSCGASLNIMTELTTLRLERSAAPSRFGSGDGLFEIPGLPKNEKQTRQVMHERGWSTETIHGKELDFCPNCKSK